MKTRIFIPTSKKARKRLFNVISFLAAFVFFVSCIPFQNFVFASNKPTSQVVNSTTDMAKVGLDYELTDLRTENSKVYRKIDGTFEEDYYNQPIHYFINGKWGDIDNTLSLDGQSSEYGNVANDYKVKLPKTINENKDFQLKLDDYSLSWNILGIQKSTMQVLNFTAKSDDVRSLKNLVQDALYKDVFENVDLEYTLSGGSIKENFILNQYKENFSVQMELKVKGLTLEDRGTDIALINDKGETVFDTNSYFMIDANNVVSNDINVNLENTGKDKYLLTITPSDSFLSDKNTAYPVKIDPSIYILDYEDSKNPIDDYYTKNGVSNINSFLSVGRDQYDNLYRSYITFKNLEDIKDKSVITYANLSLTTVAGANYCKSTCTVSVQQVENGQPVDVDNDPYYGANINIESFDYENIDNTNTGNVEFTWDLTRLFQKWKDSATNYTEGTILLKTYDDSQTGALSSGGLSFYSSDSGMANVEPMLEVGYVDSAGLNSAWTYHNQDGGFAGTGYTNDYTGNVTFVHLDSSSVGNQFSFGISHIFDNAYKDVNIGYGMGQRMNYSEQIDYTLVDSKNYIYKYRLINGDGYATYFDEIDKVDLPDDPISHSNLILNKTFIAEDGSGLILRYYEDIPTNTTLFTVQSSTGLYKEFYDIGSTSQKYTKYTDTKSQKSFTVNFDYITGEITDIVDENGNKALFYYVNDLLERIEIYRINESLEPEIYQISVYKYNENKQLTQIIDVPKEDINLFYKKQLYSDNRYWENYGSPSDWIPPTDIPPNTIQSKFQIADTKFNNEYTKQTAVRSWKDLQPGDTGYESLKYALSTPSASGDYRWVTTGDSYTEYQYQKQWWNPEASYTWNTLIGGNGTGYFSSPTSGTTIYAGNYKVNYGATTPEYYYKYDEYKYSDKVCFGVYKKSTGFLGIPTDSSKGSACYYIDETPSTSDNADYFDYTTYYTDPGLTNSVYIGNTFSYYTDSGNQTVYMDGRGSVSNGQYFVNWTTTYDDNSSYKNYSTHYVGNFTYGWTSSVKSTTSSGDYYYNYYKTNASWTDVNGNSQYTNTRYRSNYTTQYKHFYGAWQTLSSGQTGYEALKYATSTPSAPSGYQWVTTGNSRTWYEYKKQINSIDYWTDSSPTETTFIDSREDIISIDSNTRWEKIDGTERMFQKYQEQRLKGDLTESDLVNGQTGYETPKSATTTPTASAGYRWVLNDSLNDALYSTIETQANFTYDSKNNQLSTVEDFYGDGIQYYYDDITNKVKRIENYVTKNDVKELSSSLDIAYSIHETSFTTFRNEEYRYLFDNYGHTINVIDDKGNITYYFYDNIFADSPTPSNWNLNNKIIGETSTVTINNQENPDGYVESNPNLITNPGFDESNKMSGWYCSIGTCSVTYDNEMYWNSVGSPVDFYEPIIKGLGDSTNNYGSVVTIKGNPNKEYSFYQNIDIYGNAGDNFVAGGLARGFVDKIDTDENAKFYIRVRFYQPDTSFSEVDVNFNNEVIDGQYIMDSITAPRWYTRVQFSVVYQGANTISFDYFSLHKTEFKTNYKLKEAGLTDAVPYSEKTGNVSSVGLPNSENGYTYNYGDSDPYNVTSITDNKNNSTVINYNHETDGQENVQDVSIHSTHNNIKESFEYDDNNNIKNTTIGDKPGGNWFSTSTTYVSNGLFTDTVTDEFGKRIDYDYNVITGLLDSIVDKNDVRTDYTYDEYGRLKTVSKDGSTNTYYYDKGLLDEVEVNGFRYKFEYDDFGKVTHVYVVNADSEVYKELMSYIYEDDINDDGTKDYYTNQLLEQIYGNLDSIKFDYDSDGRIKGIKYKSHNDLSYELKFEYVYDSKGRLFKYIDHVNGDEIIYRYDSVGRLEKVENGTNSISFKYNTDNEFKSCVYNLFGLTRTTSYLYNDDGSYNKTTYGNVEKTYNYSSNDVLQRLDNITLNTGSKTIKQTFTYVDNVPEPDDIAVVNGNASTRIDKIEFDYTSDGQSDLSYDYHYDSVGNITHIDQFGNGITSNYDYKYDQLNQLIREDVFISADIKFTNVYEYDKYGNITSKKSYDYLPNTLTENLTDSNKTDTYIYDDIWKDQLKNYNGNEIIYDGTGNPISIGTNIALEWEGRQLVKYTDAYDIKNVLEIDYKYNDQGIRTQQIIKRIDRSNGEIILSSNEINYYLDGDKVLYESNGTDKIYYTYDVDGKIISFNYNGTEYFYIRNMQDDIVKIVDESGNVVVSYSYDAWGNIISKVDNSGFGLADKNPYRYRGYRYDEETGWYYLNSRYYNPEIGRFINADGLIGQTGEILSHNMYAYCQNNPVMMVDPNGDFPFLSGLITHAATLISGYVGSAIVSIWDKEVRADMNAIGWNPFNSNEDKVLNSKKVSFYKGSFVIRHSIPDATSCGIGGMIILNSTETDTITVKHEWGHNMQELILGERLYLTAVAAPSIYYNKTGDYTNYSNSVADRMYYSKIWERTADWLGGVDRGNYDPLWSGSNFVPW